MYCTVVRVIYEIRTYMGQPVSIPYQYDRFRFWAVILRVRWRVLLPILNYTDQANHLINGTVKAEVHIDLIP